MKPFLAGCNVCFHFACRFLSDGKKEPPLLFPFVNKAGLHRYEQAQDCFIPGRGGEERFLSYIISSPELVSVLCLFCVRTYPVKWTQEVKM
jgi:hypothetical protein